MTDFLRSFNVDIIRQRAADTIMLSMLGLFIAGCADSSQTTGTIETLDLKPGTTEPSSDIKETESSSDEYSTYIPYMGSSLLEENSSYDIPLGSYPGSSH